MVRELMRAKDTSHEYVWGTIKDQMKGEHFILADYVNGDGLTRQINVV